MMLVHGKDGCFKRDTTNGTSHASRPATAARSGGSVIDLHRTALKLVYHSILYG